MPSIGPVLRKLRTLSKKKQVEVAEAVGVSSTHLSLLESRKQEVSLRMVDRLREFLGVDVYVLTWMLEQNDPRLAPFIQELENKAVSVLKTRLKQ